MGLVWHVGDVVRKLREDERKWKQEMLAEKADLSLATIVRVEQGRETKSETIGKLASAFKLSVAQLYALIPSEKETQHSRPATESTFPASDRRAHDQGPPAGIQERRKHAQ